MLWNFTVCVKVVQEQPFWNWAEEWLKRSGQNFYYKEDSRRSAWNSHEKTRFYCEIVWARTNFRNQTISFLFFFVLRYELAQSSFLQAHKEILFTFSCFFSQIFLFSAIRLFLIVFFLVFQIKYEQEQPFPWKHNIIISKSYIVRQKTWYTGRSCILRIMI